LSNNLKFDAAPSRQPPKPPVYDRVPANLVDYLSNQITDNNNNVYNNLADVADSHLKNQNQQSKVDVVVYNTDFDGFQNNNNDNNNNNNNNNNNGVANVKSQYAKLPNIDDDDDDDDDLDSDTDYEIDDGNRNTLELIQSKGIKRVYIWYIVR
jgi:hypothetical protein